MRITYIKLVGYIGIYNGLGLNEIEINLKPGPHKITVISGINGCGKSTLLNAMSILPDSSTDFIPDVPAEKKMIIEDNDTVYEIDITSAAGKNGSRGMSKASIKKNGVELNPNGNIGSYKEIIFDEFDLDSNYIALSRLSSDDRGLADKSPSERKKFMSFIIDSLDTYNAIYKNLNKKSSIFKSYINNLHTKIQNVGDENVIGANKDQFTRRANEIETNINLLGNQMARAEARMAAIDPNGKLQEDYQKTKEDYDKYSKATSELKRNLDNMIEDLKSPGYSPNITDLNGSADQLRSEIERYKNDVSDESAERTALISKSEVLIKSINDVRTKINSLESSVNPDLRKAVDTTRKKVDNEVTYLTSQEIDFDNMSVDDLQLVYDTIKSILNMVDHFYEQDVSESVMELILNYNDNMVTDMRFQIEEIRTAVEDTKISIASLEKDKEILSSLDKRPSKCKIDDCPYIKTAYNLQTSKYSDKSVDDKLDEKYNDLKDLEDSLDYARSMMVAYENAGKLGSYYNRILDRVVNNSSILRKTKIGEKFVNEFEDNINHLRPFNEYRDLNNLGDCITILTRYKSDSKMLINLEAGLAQQSNSEALLEELKEDLDGYQKEYDDLDSQITVLTADIDTKQDVLDSLLRRLDMLNQVIDANNTYEEMRDQSNAAKAKLNDIISKNNECVELLKQQQDCSEQIAELSPQVAPLRNQAAKLQSQLDMLESYKADYEEYSKKYELVEVLKKYSSPRTGIQTVFMDMYMSKTLELANNVLGMIFGGQYKLLDYVINDNEFRMPFVGSGMVVDDISSGSTSQVCMMGMVMNLVLKYQASPKYNIASLDEIDGGLDTRNRLEFISVLYKLIDILDIDQLFIISHSLEIELSNVNIIKLKSYDDFGDTSAADEGYVLYDFNKMK